VHYVSGRLISKSCIVTAPNRYLSPYVGFILLGPTYWARLYYMLSLGNHCNKCYNELQRRYRIRTSLRSIECLALSFQFPIKDAPLGPPPLPGQPSRQTTNEPGRPPIVFAGPENLGHRCMPTFHRMSSFHRMSLVGCSSLDSKNGFNYIIIIIYINQLYLYSWR
jgi:hypothetical protein